jgi:hypothetical protein
VFGEVGTISTEKTTSLTIRLILATLSEISFACSTLETVITAYPFVHQNPFGTGSPDLVVINDEDYFQILVGRKSTVHNLADSED